MKPSPTSASFGKILVLPAWLLLALASCSPSPTVKPGHALLEIKREGVHMSRVRKPGFVAVNGKQLPAPRQHVYLSPGKQEVRIRFALPEGDPRDVNLRFEARDRSYYFVTFETFPHSPGWTVPKFNYSGEDGGIIGVPVILTTIMVDKAVYDAKERKMPVEWAQINVISADPSEGRVGNVRVPSSNHRN